jgi:HSP20 family protein
MTMALVRRSDWPSLTSGSWLSDFFDNDRFFDSDLMRKQTVPAVNVKETDQGFEIELAAPGLTKDDFKISVENRVLSISTEKRDEHEEKRQNGYTRREFSYTSFNRSFALPDNVNEEEVDANYKDGVLKLSLKKVQEKQNKRRKAIEVH